MYFAVIGLAVYSRSPGAFRALKDLRILQLPSERTLKMYMNQGNKAAGLNEKELYRYSCDYTSHKKYFQEQGKKPPLGEGVLIWDETKVLHSHVHNTVCIVSSVVM